MSGGVDSAVAAMLLRDAGLRRGGRDHAPVARPRPPPRPSARAARPRPCGWPGASAHALGIPHLTLDVAERFRAGVVEDFIAGYRDGPHPQPLRHLQRPRALPRAGRRRRAAGRAPAGHRPLRPRERRARGAAVLARAADAGKDQSYMLAMLDRADARAARLPPGRPAQGRRARAAPAPPACPAADAVESQEVCFVGEGGYAPFLERTAGLAPRPGPIEDEAGRRLGTHGGYWRFTVGQRRGIGVAGAGAPLRARHRRRAQRRDRRAARGPGHARGSRSTRPGCTASSDDGAARGARPLPGPGAARAGPARTAARPARRASTSPPTASPPGQTAALYRDGRLVAAGTIAPPTRTRIRGEARSGLVRCSEARAVDLPDRHRARAGLPVPAHGGGLRRVSASR